MGHGEESPVKKLSKYTLCWYHYEFCKDSDRLVKKFKYILKQLLSRIEKLEADKAGFRDILSILRLKSYKNLRKAA
jgi:hypothetical protein